MCCSVFNRARRRFMGRGIDWLVISEGREVVNVLCWKYDLWVEYIEMIGLCLLRRGIWFVIVNIKRNFNFLLRIKI